MSGLFPELSGAEFSPCRTWRYALWRRWGDPELRSSMLAVIGLNPSTADETEDDPTIRRCIAFAKRWRYDGLFMLNLFAFRATLPADMKRAADPVGPTNDQAIYRYCDQSSFILAAWGTHGTFRGRAEEVAKLLSWPVYCLRLTKQGHPEHPLYVPGNQKPVMFREPRRPSA